MTIHDFEKAQTKLLKDADVLDAWLEYLSRFPHLSGYFRSAPQFKNQISIVSGKKAGSDLNLYKLFVEQCFNLLRPHGRCGIVIPSGIYTDLGSKQLREKLFTEGEIDVLYGLSNERFIFEGVHHAFKVCILVFSRGGNTKSFEAGFRMHPFEAVRPEQLDTFLHDASVHVRIPVSLVRKLCPDSLSVMEFRSDVELGFAETVSSHPILDSPESTFHHIKFGREVDPTAHPKIFPNKQRNGLKPLLEGRNIHHFTSQFSTDIRFWVSEKAGRNLVLGRQPDCGQLLDYQTWRIGFRKIARNTDERTMIATIIPPSFASENLQTAIVFDSAGKRIVSNPEMLALAAIFSSFVFDAIIRMKVSANINFFFVYGTQVPHLRAEDAAFAPIVRRAAQLICTTPEFDALAKEVSAALKLSPAHLKGVTDAAARARLRAELDGMVAHLYGLTESEFAYILTTFPLVAQGVKDASLEAFKIFAPKSADVQLAADIAKGESAMLEFKSSARWDLKENRANKVMEQVIVKTAAAFLNTDGGTLLIGVDDSGKVLGLEHDFKTLGKKQDRDGFELFLTTRLLDEFGKDCSPMIQISFCQLEGKDVCRATFKPSPKPAFVKEGNAEHLFIRAGNSTRQLTTKEALEYCKQRWP